MLFAIVIFCDECQREIYLVMIKEGQMGILRRRKVLVVEKLFFVLKGREAEEEKKAEEKGSASYKLGYGGELA